VELALVNPLRDERVVPDDTLHLLRSAHDEGDLKTEPATNGIADSLCEPTRQLVIGSKDEVAALDVGAHFTASGLLEYSDQILHGQAVVTSKVNPTQEPHMKTGV
jgi:hypothetical protein